MKRSNKTLRCQTWFHRIKETKTGKYTPLKTLVRWCLKSRLHLWSVERSQSSNSQLNRPKCQTLLAILKIRALKTASYSLPSEKRAINRCTSLSLRRRLQPKCNVKLTQNLLRCRFETRAKRESFSITETILNEVFRGFYIFSLSLLRSCCPLKQVITFPNAWSTMVFSYLSEGRFNLFVHVEANFVYQTVKPCTIKLCFDFGQGRLNCIKLRWISNIFNLYHIEIGQSLFDFSCAMNRQLVHEECDLATFTELQVQSLQVGNEVVGSDSLGVNSNETDTVFWYTGYHTSVASIYVSLVHSEICVSLTITTRGNRTLGEICFVKEENRSALLFGVV